MASDSDKKLKEDVLKKIRFKGLWTPEHLDLFSDYMLLQRIIEEMVRPFRGIEVQKVAVIDGAGFLLGTLIAAKLQVGVIPIRKVGSISSPSYKVSFVDYSKRKRELEIQKQSSLKKGESVLLVDDWAETGAHLTHSLKLLSHFDVNVIGISLIVNEMNSKKRERLGDIKVEEIIDFQKIEKPDW